MNNLSASQPLRKSLTLSSSQMSSNQQKRERNFDLSYTNSLKITKVDPSQKLTENNLVLKNYLTPQPHINVQHKFKKLSTAFYDFAPGNFEEIKQLQNYDQLIKKQLSAKQNYNIQKCDFIRNWRDRDQFVQQAKFTANLMKKQGFSHDFKPGKSQIGDLFTQQDFAINTENMSISKSRVARMVQLQNVMADRPKSAYK